MYSQVPNSIPGYVGIFAHRPAKYGQCLQVQAKKEGETSLNGIYNPHLQDLQINDPRF